LEFVFTLWYLLRRAALLNFRGNLILFLLFLTWNLQKWVLQKKSPSLLNITSRNVKSNYQMNRYKFGNVKASSKFSQNILREKLSNWLLITGAFEINLGSNNSVFCVFFMQFLLIILFWKSFCILIFNSKQLNNLQLTQIFQTLNIIIIFRMKQYSKTIAVKVN
jgi:hypothetical protein